MRVLLVTHEASRTGAPRVAVEIASTLVSSQHQVTVMMRSGGPLADELTAASSRCGFEPLWRVRGLLRMMLPKAPVVSRIEEFIAYCVLRVVRPDLVYLNTVKSACYVRPARRLGLPVVLHVHELGRLASSTLNRYDLGRYFASISMVACSEAVRDDLARLTGASASRIIVIPSVVDAGDVARRAESGNGLRRTPADLVVGACARANPGKGVDQWLEAVRLIQEKEPDLPARFVWVGAHDSDATALAQRLEVSDAVEFLGETENPYPLIASMDVFTLPSRQDAFPLVVLEAMLLGRPVVAFDVGGVREQLGDCGVLVPAGDVDQLADAIVGLLKDPDVRARLGSAAATRAREQFGIERFRHQVLSVVEQTAVGTTQQDALLRFEPSSHEPGTPRAFLLTSKMDIRAHDASGWILPHSADSITEAGWGLSVSTRHDRAMWTTGPLGWMVAKLENATAPLLQTALAARELARADVVIAMFESQGNALALLRALRIPPFTRPRFAVVSCWLSRDLARFGPFRRRLYRMAYSSVDRLICFSPNQAEIFERQLGYPSENVVALNFGIDDEYFTPRPGEERGYVLSVGRDAGRDWATLFDAVAGMATEVRVACRLSAIEHLDVPDNVEVLGFVDRSTYRDLIAGAGVVVVATHGLPYPSGQTVTLEAMAMGRCCIVTDTPQVRSYLRDGQNSLLVPPGDAAALRAAIERALGDPELRARLGDAARSDVERDLNAPLMWKRIGEALR